MSISNTTRKEAEPVENTCEVTEAHEMLVGLIGRKGKHIPQSIIADHVLTVTEEMDWPVARAALEAVLRRMSFAERDGLRVLGRPQGGARLGLYYTGKSSASVRPYETAIYGVSPIAASCNCPDFLRSSLGVCKHALCVLQDIYSGERKLKKAIQEQEAYQHAQPGTLVWDPVRPAVGEADLLRQVRWTSWRKDSREPQSSRILVAKWFRPSTGGKFSLKKTYAEQPTERLALVSDLIKLYRHTRRNGHAKAVLPDPALESYLTREKEQLKTTERVGIERTDMTRHLRSLKRSLYPYQKEAVRHFLTKRHLLLADDMGLGKTAQAIASCHVLWHGKKVRRGLLIVPAALKSQWEREWHHFTNAPVTVIEGNQSEREQIYRRHKKGFLITNYEQVLRDLELVHRWAPQLVVLDEAQRIKNWESKTSAYIKSLTPLYRLVLTGTPMENRLEELATIYDWVDDYALQPKWRLVPWHSVYVDGTKELIGARNLDTLRERLRPKMVRRVRQEVLSQLPTRTDTRIPIAMTPLQVEYHDDLSQPIAQLMAKSKHRPLTQKEFLILMQLLTQQRIISNGLELANFTDTWPELSGIKKLRPSFLEGLHSPKLLELRNLIERVVLEQDRKVIIFSQWRRMLTLAEWATRELLLRAGHRAVFFTGQESQKRRTHNIVDFHDDPNVRIFFATDAGGVGLNLQRAANCCINLELPWNPAVLEQRIARIYRLGQDQPIDVYNLISNYGIESRIADLVGNKQALFSGLFDGANDQVKFEESGSFLERLEKIVKPVEVPSLADQIQVDDFEDQEALDLVEEQLLSDDDEPEPASQIALEPTPPKSHIPDDPTASFSPAQFTEALGNVRTEWDDAGNLTLRADPDAAKAIATVFQSMASLLLKKE